MKEREEMMGTIINLNNFFENLVRQSEEKEHNLIDEITSLKGQLANFSEERFSKIDQDNKKYYHRVQLMQII